MTLSEPSATQRAAQLRQVTPALVVVLVTVALCVGHLAGIRAVQRDVPDAHSTVATVLAVTAAPQAGGPFRSTVRAHWTGPDGRAHTGPLVLGGRPAPGETRTIWTDREGAPRPTPTEGNGTAVTAAALVLLSGGGLLLRARLIASRRAGREIGGEWAALEPGWSGRGSTP
ncbi:MULTISPECIES: hypothetical protein [Pseudonocardia]|uniref:hypothetical protein n=1 Tax=Pseudonocardia TaxID=1847 RepID=UPI000F7B511D|nr:MULTISPECIES: hypothetical protein [Pseudonocardia]